MDALEPRRPSEGARVPRYLPALDGLRAFSVLAVIGFHAELPYFRGGFLGVEVFFVVSGYLITQLLLEEQRKTGRISLPQFWLRRARRLLPALFVLLLAALALSLTVAPDALSGTRGDCAAALFYVSNWWQVIHHHSYFMDVERPPLLLHLWSLSVEEQFYLVWPLWWLCSDAVHRAGCCAWRSWAASGRRCGWRGSTIRARTLRACTSGVTPACRACCSAPRSR